MDAEILADEPIWGAAAGEHAHEWEVGDGLHGGEHEGRAEGREQVAHGSMVAGSWSDGRKRLDLQAVVASLAATPTLKERPVDSDLLHTEKILADRKTFYLDLKQNQRGMVVKITEDVSGNRDTIMVPAEILGDFIAALSDIKATADEHA